MLTRCLTSTFTIIAILISSGCSLNPHLPPMFEVNIDSIASPQASMKRTYILLPGDASINLDDLQFQEFSKYLLPVLASLDYKPALTTEEADLAIFLSYGIGDPELIQRTYSQPNWGQTGISSINTTTFSNRIGNTTSSTSTSTVTPSYGITGYSTYSETSVVYSRYLQINGYDFDSYKKDGRLSELWKTTLTSSGSSNDLRRVFPVILGAGAPYIGYNTKQIRQTTIAEDANVVRLIKGNVFDFEPPAEESIRVGSAYLREIYGIE